MMIESRVPNNQLAYFRNQESLKLSLLDYFDGYNISYKLDYYDRQSGKNTSFEYYMPEDTKDSYVIDISREDNPIIAAFQFYHKYLFLFFKKEYTLQVRTILSKIS